MATPKETRVRGILRTVTLAVTVLVAVAGSVAIPSAASAESNGGVRVLPLGDSITDGFNVPGGYRIGLWQRLAAGAYTVDFVGSSANGPAALADHDHEGHSGWRIDQLDVNIVAWLQARAPRTVLLHIGTNDMNQNHDVANAPARLSALIDKIRATSPGVELFVATITPESDATRETRVRAYNAAIPGIVAQKGPLTHLVDMHSALTTADLADGVHPNATGYDRMAARWYDALRSVPSSLRVEPPVGVAVPVGNPQSLKCLDVQNSGTANGTQVQLWTCNGTGAQKFIYTTAGAIVNVNSGACVDVTSGGTANGTKVQLYGCNGTGAQRWAVR